MVRWCRSDGGPGVGWVFRGWWGPAGLWVGVVELKGCMLMHLRMNEGM